MNQSIYLLVPILLPLLGGAGLYFLPRRQQRRRVFNAVLALQIVYVTLTFGINRSVMLGPGGVFTLGLGADTPGKLSALLFGVLFWATGWFGFDTMDRLGRATLPCFLAALSALTGLCYAATLPLFCLFYLLGALLAFTLLCPGRKMLLYRLLYTSLTCLPACCGCALLARYLPSLQFRSGGVLSSVAFSASAAPLLTTALLMLAGFCATIFLPLCVPVQQPGSSPAAHTLLAALLPGAGVLGVLRLIYYLFGSRFLQNTLTQHLLVAACLVVMLCASLCAFWEQNIFKRLAWCTVAQSSCLLLGLFILHRIAFMGALLQAFFHPLCTVCLFLCADALYTHTGTLQANRFHGVGLQMPLELGCFTAAGLALIGCPPLSWFFAKKDLFTGLLAQFGRLGKVGSVVLVLCLLLAAWYLLVPAVQGFFPGKGHQPDAKVHTSLSVILPVACLLVCLLGLGLFPGYLQLTIRTIAVSIL